MKERVELLLLDAEGEYREEFIKTYTHCTASHQLWGYPIVFYPEDFDHIFFEPAAKGKGREFSKRRARRLYFIREMLLGRIEREIMFESDTGNIAIFCEKLESVMYLRPRRNPPSFQIGTFFDFGRDHTKMYKKQKRKCIPISNKGIQKLFRK